MRQEVKLKNFLKLISFTYVSIDFDYSMKLVTHQTHSYSDERKCCAKQVSRRGHGKKNPPKAIFPLDYLYHPCFWFFLG